MAAAAQYVLVETSQSGDESGAAAHALIRAANGSRIPNIGQQVASFATVEGHETRLLLGLIACGLEESAIAAQFLAVHPGGTVPEGLGLVAPERAAALLSGYERS